MRRPEDQHEARPSAQGAIDRGATRRYRPAPKGMVMDWHGWISRPAIWAKQTKGEGTDWPDKHGSARPGGDGHEDRRSRRGAEVNCSAKRLAINKTTQEAERAAKAEREEQQPQSAAGTTSTSTRMRAAAKTKAPAQNKPAAPANSYHRAGAKRVGSKVRWSTTKGQWSCYGSIKRRWKKRISW